MQNCSLQQDSRLESSGERRASPATHVCGSTAIWIGADWCTWQGNYISGQGGDAIRGDFPFKNLQQKPA